MTASLEALFAQHRLNLLGFADTAFVFSRPERPDQVVKVGIDVEDGWPAWAAWSRTYPSPHVPVIHSCTWVHDGAGRPQLFIGLMERLHKTAVARPWIRPDGGSVNSAIKRDPFALADLVEAEHPSIAAMLRAAGKAHPTAHWDMTPSNWMARADGTLVLTDPWSRLG